MSDQLAFAPLRMPGRAAQQWVAEHQPERAPEPPTVRESVALGYCGGACNGNCTPAFATTRRFGACPRCGKASTAGLPCLECGTAARAHKRPAEYR